MTTPDTVFPPRNRRRKTQIDHNLSMAAAKKNVNLTAKWQLDAALLSRPVDLTALVSMARSHPDKFLDDNTLQRLVTLLLNEKNKSKSDKDTKLDVLNILANVAAGSKKAVAEVPLVCPFSHPLLSALSLLLHFLLLHRSVSPWAA